MKSGLGCLDNRSLTASAHKAALRPSHSALSNRGLVFQAERWPFAALKTKKSWMEKGNPLTPAPTKAQIFKCWWSKNPNLRFGIIFLWPTVKKELKDLRKGGCFEEFSHWQLPYEQGSICQHPIWRTAEPPGDGPHGPARENSGVVRSPRGGLTFPGHRSEVKETLPEGRPLTTLVWKKPPESKQYLSSACWEHHYNMMRKIMTSGLQLNLKLNPHQLEVQSI